MFYERVLIQSRIDLYQKLIANHEFDEAVKTAYTSHLSKKQYWTYQAFSKSKTYQIGLLTIYKSVKMPLHDHPGAFGVQYVISGEMRIQKYQYRNEMLEKKSIVALEKVADLQLSQGEFSSYQPVQENIHQLESLTERTILLSITVHPYKPRERSWYFPMNSPKELRENLFNRLQ